jgi:hypothetical protein
MFVNILGSLPTSAHSALSPSPARSTSRTTYVNTRANHHIAVATVPSRLQGKNILPTISGKKYSKVKCYVFWCHILKQSNLLYQFLCFTKTLLKDDMSTVLYILNNYKNIHMFTNNFDTRNHLHLKFSFY